MTRATSDTIELLANIITGMIGGWACSYLRAKASKFAWGDGAHYGLVGIWWVVDQVGSVLLTSGIGLLF